jgi:hypothetical protein
VDLGGRTLRWASLAFLLATSLLACLPSFPSDSAGDGGGDHDVTPTDGALRSDAPAHIVDGGDTGSSDGGTPGLGSDADAASTSDQSVGTDEDADAELAPDQSAGPDSGIAVLEAGIDAPVCNNVCTAGATECGTGAVETCTVQANGCTLWEPTTQCGANRMCSVTAGVAACACVGTICSEAGEACQGGATVATCAKDANGCLYVASRMTCASPMVCAGTAPDVACSLKCSNTCTAGQKSCVSTEIATCALGSNGCDSYSPAVACASVNESCTGTAGSASCSCLVDPVCHTVGNTCSSNDTMTTTCAADAQGCIYNAGSKTCTNGACSNGACCTNSCTEGQKTCVSGNIETCTLGSNGCWAYGAAGCPTHETCTGAAGSAQCTCAPSACTSAADFCSSTSVRTNCAQDGPTKCFYEPSPTTTTCTNGACSNGACCTNTCTAGQKTCVGADLETCTLGSNGCYSYGPAGACPAHETCTGAAGSAQCTCVGNACTSTAAVCVPETSTLADCVQDSATKCFFESGTPTTCNSGCSDGACCPLVCISGTTQCLLSTSTESQTCGVSSSGCINWATTHTCPGDDVCERHGTPACVDPNWAEWPIPNSSLDVEEGAPLSSQQTFSESTDSTTATDAVTGLVWQLGVGGPMSNQSDAEDYCRTLTLPAGSQTTDWRLPTIIELASLVDITAASESSGPSTILPGGIAAAVYWSMTAVAPSGTGLGWAVDFSSGGGESVNISVGTLMNVLCVR